ncbi:UDP-N-acetylmuramate dehydrogenase [Sulfurirhabdus autotrophica]|uniref:UDP-N-acetylenolpyruvoylglucosamine reductase n=1 Tax=Sulfurirhabdus autotrophica TaxID=1706046 RepID=A0A4R3XVR1_9PROT|nr:UDP-N-acetylmuramate dehydrogenase [Sulfurirhabdus autotrophica]TCV83017.1 UDP-N-acetylmuramate dehydrogenase [Sulfurirhabdus autotrophica]
MRRSEEVNHGRSCGGVSPAYFNVEPSGLRGELRQNEPMQKHTSWRAGGVADQVYIPADLADLSTFLRNLPKDEAVHMVGLGSNLLVRDGGLRGTVILVHGALKRICIEQRKNGFATTLGENIDLVYAEAGVASPKVARYAARHNLVGAEFLAGIPGTVGGALAMNAGCYGAETWEVVAKVLTLNRNGELHKRMPADYEISYRHVLQKMSGDNVPLAREWYVGAWFKLPKGDGEASLAKIKSLLQKRIASQPLNMPNAGSVFRNPEGDYAARLIEDTGLKGVAIGGAMVSTKHANFIVNTGSATATDIEMLIDKVQEAVNAKHGIQLVREVRIVGESIK